jgi:CRISPR-associated endonuclease/helicase Cas3
VALPPELAAYDADLGFRLLLDGPFPPDEHAAWKSKYVPPAKGKRDEIGGKQSSYVEHISGLIRAYRFSVQHEFAWVAARLERALHLPAGSLDHALRLAIACHDIGKLSQGWQAWAHGWPNLLVAEKGLGYAVTPQRAFLAKTDRLSYHEEKRLRAKMTVSRPHHACESALASMLFIGKRLSATAQGPSGIALTKATISAIARHHTALASVHEAAAWDATARTALAAALEACQLPTDTTDLALTALAKGEIPAKYLLEPSHLSPEAIAATWLGFALVRALRLCDQRAEREL